MSEKSITESAENLQGLEESGSETSAEDPVQAAIIKRYGFSKQQSEESKLFL